MLKIVDKQNSYYNEVILHNSSKNIIFTCYPDYDKNENEEDNGDKVLTVK